MTHQQFIVVPPLGKIAPIFITATGRSLVAGVAWNEWKTVSAHDLEALRPYFRPCHQATLNRVVAGGSPQTLLRQLLRPYEYRIEAGIAKGSWVLRQGEEPVAAVNVGKGRTVSWSD
jgi:hypothetical protein